MIYLFSGVLHILSLCCTVYITSIDDCQIYAVLNAFPMHPLFQVRPKYAHGPVLACWSLKCSLWTGQLALVNFSQGPQTFIVMALSPTPLSPLSAGSFQNPEVAHEPKNVDTPAFSYCFALCCYFRHPLEARVLVIKWGVNSCVASIFPEVCC